jgi:hypothetical protein
VKPRSDSSDAHYATTPMNDGLSLRSRFSLLPLASEQLLRNNRPVTHACDVALQPCRSWQCIRSWPCHRSCLAMWSSSALRRCSLASHFAGIFRLRKLPSLIICTFTHQVCVHLSTLVLIVHGTIFIDRRRTDAVMMCGIESRSYPTLFTE